MRIYALRMPKKSGAIQKLFWARQDYDNHDYPSGQAKTHENRIQQPENLAESFIGQDV